MRTRQDRFLSAPTRFAVFDNRFGYLIQTFLRGIFVSSKPESGGNFIPHSPGLNGLLSGLSTRRGINLGPFCLSLLAPNSGNSRKSS